MLSHLSRMQLCDPMDCILPDSSVNGILQARILQWVAMPSSRESPWPSLVKITQSFSNAEIIFSHSSMNQNKYVLCVQNSPGRQQHLSDLVDVGRSRGAVFLLVSERKAKGSSAETLQPRGGHLLAGKHGPPKPGKDSQPCGISQQWSCSHPERRLPGGRRRRCRAPAAPALPHSRWSACRGSPAEPVFCLRSALCFPLFLAFFPRRLDANRISSVPPSCFSGLHSLRHLWLDDNALTEIPVQAFRSLSALQAMTLALNKIHHIPDYAFGNLSSLVVL